MKIKWKCKLCNDVVESNSLYRHDMNYCKCGNSAVDAEYYYMRCLGEVEFISPTHKEISTFYKKVLGEV